MRWPTGWRRLSPSALHQRVRQEFWGYEPNETLSRDDMIAEKYRGIRPAPGYPAQPDHTEKGTLFGLLDSERIGVKLTESYAMWPGAACAGSISATRRATISASARSSAIKSRDYARRKGWSVAECERWLAPVLNYNPHAEVPRIAAA